MDNFLHSPMNILLVGLLKEGFCKIKNIQYKLNENVKSYVQGEGALLYFTNMK